MLKIDDISKKFKKQILQNISFNVEKGEILSIIGINGSGKSTLLSIITSVIKADKGTISIDDKDLTKNPHLVKKYIGYVPQDNVLFENLTVLDNIKFWAIAYKKNYKNFIYDDKILNQKIKNLSEGMKKRLSIKIALINNPDYLIMDEPTAVLDIDYKTRILNTMLERKSDGRSVIFTTHNVEEMLSSDRIIAINQGKIVFNDSPNSLNNNNIKENILDLILTDNKLYK